MTTTELTQTYANDSATSSSTRTQETQSRSGAVHGWQPIETLPRDGRYVLVYRPLAMETQDETLAIARTLTKGSMATVSPQGVKHWTSRWCHPTHWMDLPALPSPPEKQG